MRQRPQFLKKFWSNFTDFCLCRLHSWKGSIKRCGANRNFTISRSVIWNLSQTPPKKLKSEKAKCGCTIITCSLGSKSSPRRVYLMGPKPNWKEPTKRTRVTMTRMLLVSSSLRLALPKIKLSVWGNHPTFARPPPPFRPRSEVVPIPPLFPERCRTITERGTRFE